MTLKASLVGKVVSDLGEGNYKIGTAYPIRSGVVITAYHVVYDIEKLNLTSIEWGEGNSPSPITRVAYENKAEDIALLECDTPNDIPIIDICSYVPEFSEKWDSFGFPDAGIDHDLEIREKVPTGGGYVVQSDETCEMYLTVGSKISETKLWQGMSGAPVFTTGTRKLTGIIRQSPGELSAFPDSIYATSLALLLEKCDEFAAAVAINSHCHQYINKQRDELLKELKELKDDMEMFYKSLAIEFKVSPFIGLRPLVKTMHF